MIHFNLMVMHEFSLLTSMVLALDAFISTTSIIGLKLQYRFKTYAQHCSAF